MRCRNNGTRYQAWPCASQPQPGGVDNGVTKTFTWFVCSRRPVAPGLCVAANVSTPGTGSGNHSIHAPYMCLQLTPAASPSQSQCTCWARVGGKPVDLNPLPLLPKDVCNPIGVYTRFDAATVTPANNKCCPGLLFGCLDSAGGNGCNNPPGTTVTKFCYDPANPIWQVDQPLPLLFNGGPGP